MSEMDKRPMMSDEEIEALLRRQPRRTPSPALWARLSEEAPRRARRVSALWAGAATAVVLAVMLVLAMSRTAPVPPAATHSTVGAQHAVPPQPASTRVAAGAQHAVPLQTVAKRPKLAVPPPADRGLRAQVSGTGRDRWDRLEPVSGRAPRERPSVSSTVASGLSPPAPGAGGPASTSQDQLHRPLPASATPVAPAPPEAAYAAAAPPTAAAEPDGTASTYYLEVSRGGTGSVVSGSVTRDHRGSVTEIEMTYDTVHRTGEELRRLDHET